MNTQTSTEKHTGKRDRAAFEGQSNLAGSLLRCITSKSIGKIANPDLKQKKIVDAAEHPINNQLKARTNYWFVTTEQFELTSTSPSLLTWSEHIQFVDNKTTYFLNRIFFGQKKKGTIEFKFPNGLTETFNVTGTNQNQNKRHKAGNPVNNAQIEEADIQYSPKEDFHEYFTGEVPAGSWPIDELNNTNLSLPNGFALNDNQDHVTIEPPRDLSNGMQLPACEALCINILLLVPAAEKYINVADTTLTNVGFTKEASSSIHLYSQKNLNMTRHVLLFPYGGDKSYYKAQDFLYFASEAILMIEDESGGEHKIMAVEWISDPNNPNNYWRFTVKTSSFFERKNVEYRRLNERTRYLLSIGELRYKVLGGAYCPNNIDEKDLLDQFKKFFLEWTLAPVKHQVVQNIYLCFKFEPYPVHSFTEYASKTLNALGIQIENIYEPVVVNGSVLVYIRCPSYTPWYILTRKHEIFETLRSRGLNISEIYECTISDVEKSMALFSNEIFLDELTFLQELMISDGVTEQPSPNGFRVAYTETPESQEQLPDKILEENLEHEPTTGQSGASDYPPTIDRLPKVVQSFLEQKCTALSQFGVQCKPEDCYNSDIIHQQLFNFAKEGEPRPSAMIAVRVFLASASARFGTNVAKLIRKFEGLPLIDGLHSGLQIANTIVEWNQSGIVHIGELKHAKAVAVLYDVQESVKFQLTEEIANKMVKVIQKWNTEHKYSSDYSSHRFVKDFLQATLQISLLDQFKGPLGEYMNHVMRTADPTPRLFSSQLGELVFKSHEELEKVEQEIKNKLTNSELKLMKIFHRGFQLQEAASGKDAGSCFYGHPTNGLEILNDIGINKYPIGQF